MLPLLLASPLVHAQANGTPVEIAAGKQRAAVCFACHNANGISRMPGTPNLAGQDRSYLENALRDYRGGQDRKNPVMNAMAQPLSDRDIADISTYFSSLPHIGAKR
jgi:cytochrome c553